MFTSLLVAVGLAVSTFGAIVERDLHVSRTSAAATTTTSNIPVPTSTGPPNFNITSLGLNGSGCPPGSAFYILNDQHTAVTITFSAFEASAGPDISITENRKNCQVSLNVHVPQGFSFAIVDVDYRGFYELDTKVKAFHDATYYFQGQLVQSEATSTLTGPVDGKNYVYRDEFNLTPTIYSPCGEDTVLNINSQVRVDNSGNRKGYGFVTDDSIDASITQTFNFQWLTCTK
ncbi:hypothetical protein V5O48_010725 [Marasmius crinis-equi]|uniref:Secreted protein n=1 Tax=Marasmius crinis-equi TaxID=585013 RepID=A0ABR3F7J4_9AGAR